MDIIKKVIFGGKWENVRRLIDEEEDFPTQIEYKIKVLKAICENILVPLDELSM